MNAALDGDVVHLSAPGRQRFYDNRGYGHPDGDALDLAPVEAAHLLFRGDIESVDGMDFRSFLATTDCTLDFLVYKDLRDRGFYLSPARWYDDGLSADFVVYPRGDGPWDDGIEYRMRVVGERERVAASSLDQTLAVVDEESEITYLGVDDPDITGSSDTDLPSDVYGALLADRVVLWDPPADLYRQAFYGRPLDGREADGPLQCSLLEAAYLAERGAVSVDAEHAGIVERGRQVEGDRFDRRLAVYRELRERDVVPKTGFKFGSDFRTYADVESADDLGHSEFLVRVVGCDHEFAPRDLALDVRLAHGVRKTIVFALVDGSEVEWVSLSRLTP
ncbi:tRNA-intron lyase [Halomarina oriensis]|uniref:tRNA-splicing endonuclease n=1 Tax=Halomarina oriensis TaxID=671145 RepID=A0A6B0GQH6_9EURY|nr:tRNA-intron lyase [Halomarina oriensis]MWG34923.1 tRNA-intron lyase [Halomarina oriensis]